MSPLVINILPVEVDGKERDVVHVLETPTKLASQPATQLALDARDEPFSNLLNEPPEPGIVRLCGDTLFASLGKNRRFERTTLDLGTRTAIYFKLESPATENLPWEALWHQEQNCFVALQEPWPIARLAPSGQASDATSSAEPELKILIVLAAARGGGDVPVDAAGEWQAIWTALSQSQHSKKLRVHVLYCQDEIRKALKALADPRITYEPLASEQTFRQAVDSLLPNIVHFFCHGSSEAAQPRIELAKPSDYDAELREGSIRLTSADLAVLGRSHSVWLVTLNCCQGARSAGRVRSIAADIAGNGVPAVVAMRESVDFRKAHVFAGKLYATLVDKLGTYLPTEAEADAGLEREVPEDTWLNAMFDPRKALSTKTPELEAAWTLPVVYIQRGPLKLKGQPRSTALLPLFTEAIQAKLKALKIETEQLRAVRAAMQATGTPNMLQDFDGLIQNAARRTDLAEREAIIDLLARPGLSELERDTANLRLDELNRRQPQNP